jgi:RNA polymerase sigma factor (sigma-70 family)
VKFICSDAPQETEKTALIYIGGKSSEGAPMRPTEAEQNRLIQGHMGMVAPIAADYRGRKGIPFEEMEAQGMLGLVQAARMWRCEASFPTYAAHKIRSAIKDFIDAWQHLVAIDELDDRDEERIHEWQVWGGFPYEGWNSLPASPEEIMMTYQSVAGQTDALKAAMISLTGRERKMLSAHFLRSPRVGLEQIARDNHVSYYRAVEIIYDAVRKLRDVVEKIERRKTPRHASRRISRAEVIAQKPRIEGVRGAGTSSKGEAA